MRNMLTVALVLSVLGCRSYQYGHVVKDNQPSMVGSHSAGSEVYDPLVDEAVAKLLGACGSPMSLEISPEGFPVARQVCFVGIENKSAEELADFKDQLYEQIDTQINRSQSFRAISRHMVDVALHETRLRPDSLFIPANRQLFADVLQQQGSPVDYLLYATLTSGTTERNSSSQRDYTLTLELVDTRSGEFTKEQAFIRKGYHRSPLGRLANYNPFTVWR
ncbi:MAG: penicillin-binding protein activator LpoB [Planctomycetales bacterium]|nr:penicillin-binding protein activator LpoB [Planctomycetales bacterium]